ncbi:hypothetical protein [Argonema galeatum]|uniref:hypothetical protein n=1 Tax=Argonema galeatum TaxID=2942762 RepID=UPI002013B651|nr:hypothetical protein [Argonema galeatum]
MFLIIASFQKNGCLGKVAFAAGTLLRFNALRARHRNNVLIIYAEQESMELTSNLS